MPEALQGTGGRHCFMGSFSKTISRTIVGHQTNMCFIEVDVRFDYGVSNVYYPLLRLQSQLI